MKLDAYIQQHNQDKDILEHNKKKLTVLEKKCNSTLQSSIKTMRRPDERQVRMSLNESELENLDLEAMKIQVE